MGHLHLCPFSGLSNSFCALIVSGLSSSRNVLKLTKRLMEDQARGCGS